MVLKLNLESSLDVLLTPGKNSPGHIYLLNRIINSLLETYCLMEVLEELVTRVEILILFYKAKKLMILEDETIVYCVVWPLQQLLEREKQSNPFLNIQF